MFYISLTHDVGCSVGRIFLPTILMFKKLKMRDALAQESNKAHECDEDIVWSSICLRRLKRAILKLSVSKRPINMPMTLTKYKVS